MAPRVCSYVPVMVGILALPVIGCTSYQDPAVKPDDAEYPEKNPKPAHQVTLIAEVPGTFAVEFVLAAKGGEAVCQRKVGPGFYSSVVMAHSLPMTQIASNTYQTIFYTDEFLPGSCQWQFSEIEGKTVRPDSQWFGLLGRSREPGSDDVRLHIWCVTTREDSQRPERCSSLQSLSGSTNRVSEATVAAATPESTQSADGTIGTATTTVHVVFHDIDNIQK